MAGRAWNGKKSITGVNTLAKYSSVVEAVQDNILAFLLGWLVGAGLAPMLIEQITATL
jgi:hypothetical protein